jgi:hypothetical protein
MKNLLKMAFNAVLAALTITLLWAMTVMMFLF